MGKKLQTVQLKWQAYVITLTLAIVIGLIYSIFQYTREFFVMYQSVNHLFLLLQMICIGLMIALLIIVVLQYNKAGKYTFYTNGFVNEKTKEQYLYHDMMAYRFDPQNNRQAKAIIAELDNGQTVQLNALLPSKAFHLFQEGHAAVWGPFLIEKLKAKQIITFTVYPDVTSFKLKGQLHVDPMQISVSHEGIVLNETFIKWHQLSRVEMSWTGMLSIKDVALKTIWLEPIVSIANYYDFIYVLQQMIGSKVSE